jgi:drug/metabolite transporter (DMT)-like permease
MVLIYTASMNTNDSQPLSQTGYKILMVFAMFFWAANWTTAKLVSGMMPAQTLIFYRFFLSIFAFLPLLFLKKISLKLSAKQAIVVGLSSLAMGLYQWFFFKGLYLGAAGNGGVIVTSLNPLFTFCIAAMLRKKALSKKEVIGLTLGLLGAVFFLELWHVDSAALMHSGTVYFIAAALLWSFLSIIGQFSTVPPLAYTFYAFAAVTPLFLIGTSYADLALIGNMGLSFWLNMGFIVIFGTVFSTTSFFYATQRLGAKSAASFLFLVPVMAVIIAAIVLGEALTWPTAVGGTLALLGVYILNK